ncbi:hypothetical protein [Sphingomonas oryzagri]
MRLHHERFAICSLMRTEVKMEGRVAGKSLNSWRNEAALQAIMRVAREEKQ